MSDEALVAACAVGEVAALGALFDRYHAAVFGFLSRFAASREGDLDDLVQATFLEVQRAAAAFRGGSRVKTWIFGIAVNVARNHARSEGRRLATASAFAEQPRAAAQGPEEIAVSREFLARLGRALAGLPHDLRVAFVMCDIEGIPGVEAARALGVREGTFSRHLYEARRALRDALGGER
jgi:RNA polymerase sigma-70 factor (ECF subfamily)